MFDSFESTIGQRIRYYRQRAQMTQKALAEACGITEPAIRNYELGNRIPSFETLDDIANALHINYYALAEPNLAALAGVMQCFFRMEYAHGLKPVNVNGKAVLAIDSEFHGTDKSFLQQMLNVWLDARTKLDNGEYNLEMYEDWQCRYPFSASEDNDGDSKPSDSTVPDGSEKPKQKRGRKPKKKT